MYTDISLIQDLHSDLEIIGLPSDKLASRYLSELTQLQCEQEDTGSECAAVLHFSVVYYKETSTVEVNVIQTIDLPHGKGTLVDVHESYIITLKCMHVNITLR